MNKKIIATAIVAMITLCAGTAFADPVDVNGTIKYEYRNNNDKNTDPSTANQLSIGINFSSKIDTNTTAFARIAGRNSDWGKSNGNNNFKLDQFGVSEKMDNWTFALGRQGAQLGQGGIVYAGINIDPISYFDGVVATTKFGEVNFKAIGGAATHVTDSNSNEVWPRTRWIGADFNADLTKDINFGLAFARESTASTGTNLWSAYTTVKTGSNLTWTGEYVKSSENSSNKAYDFSGTYSWEKNSFTVAYNHVEANAVDPYNSSIGGYYYPNGVGYVYGVRADGSITTPAYKGFTYAYHHDVRKNLGLNVYYMSLEPLDNSLGKDNEYAANLQWKF